MMVASNVWWWKTYPERDKEWVCQYPSNLSPLSGENIAGADVVPASGKLGLYLHVPFCAEICASCDYNKFQAGGKEVARFVDALLREIDLYEACGAARGVEVQYLYFGGGTPSILPPHDFERILNCVRSAFHLAPDVEVSVESHPTTLSDSRIEGYWAAGINRISLGAQTFSDECLTLIGRRQRAQDTVRIVKKARATGFQNLNLDLMFGLPGQTMSVWQADLVQAVALGVDHISCYEYMVVPSGTLGQDVQAGRVPPMADAAEKERMTQAAFDVLRAAGFVHYKSQSSCGFDFAQPGKECRYEVLHVSAPQTEYIPMGAGAFGYFRGYMYCTIHTVDEYIREVEAGRLPVLAGVQMDETERMSRFMVLGMKRLRVSKLAFKNEFDRSLESVFGDALARLVGWGLIEQDADEVRVTEKGKLYGDNISKEFYSQRNHLVRQPSSMDLCTMSRQRFGR